VPAQRRLLATKRYKKLQLTLSQEHAIDLLICGKTDREVAEALGIHRVTVTRWRLYHPGFQAALNARRAAVWDTIKDRVRALLLDATDAISADSSLPAPRRQVSPCTCSS
jgi:FixJ family two-component response regulator